MVNLRYHIVSLTAVFLALGLGILAGTTVIDQEVVKGLRGNTRALQRTLDARNAEIGDLKSQLSLYERLSTAVIPPLLRGELAGRSVLIVSDAKVGGGLVRQISEALSLANAKRPTLLALTERWALEQPATAQQLATILGISSTDRETVIEEAASRMAARLAGSSDPNVQSDLIGTLEDSGFLDVDDLPQTGAFPAANSVVIVVTSGALDATPGEDTFFMPLLRRLSSARTVGVTEAMGAERSFVEKVRGDRALASTVCTVDHADTVAGRLSLVYALRDLAQGRAAAHYGVRGGADAVAPDVRP